ncbi:MAG: hypothetical protein OXC37_00130 [Bdellovibrionaceae bacterium]|nr:hypothetical protein [Pseudobdellovibrionaceae bacterium]
MKLIFTLFTILSLLSACGKKTSSDDQVKNSDLAINQYVRCQDLKEKQMEAGIEWEKQRKFVEEARKSIIDEQKTGITQEDLKFREKILDDLLKDYETARDEFNSNC